jgi:glycosyltransferase involved in cell wall biosynthesis
VTRLTVVRQGAAAPQAAPGETIATVEDIARWVKSGRAIGMLRRFDESRILVHRLESAGRPLPLGLALRWITKGAVTVEDARGRRRAIDADVLAGWITQISGEPFQKRSLVREIEHAVRELEQHPRAQKRPAVDLARPALYLRSDLSFGVRAGGSVGHIAGVVNQLKHFGAPPVFVTTDDIATLDAGVEQHLAAPPEAFWNFQELPTFVLNDALDAAAIRALAGRTPSFIYQRYSLNNFTGVRLARRMGVPFVVEYNGSEIWMSRHWGRPLKYERLSDRIERLNLQAADLVVVVSRAMEDEIVARGVERSRVLANPNGVDPDRYSPAVDGSAVRAKYGLKDAIVIGFIGTFGPWHGAETLARAFVQLRGRVASNVRLLMIGEGATLAEVKRILSEGRTMDAAAFTGLVPQEEGAKYLAACDVLASPHVPNPDGTPFFGSPTKLFEYMAMGKGIVASRLDQIGDVLEEGKTALLVPPGGVDALAAAIARLAGDRELRECLGAEARRVAVERHTWREHTRRTIDALRA